MSGKSNVIGAMLAGRELVCFALELAGLHKPACHHDGLWYCHQHNGIVLHPCREFEIALAQLRICGIDPADEEIAAVSSLADATMILANVLPPFGQPGGLRWGVFVRDPAEGPEWTERYRWIGQDLDVLTSQQAAEARAAEIAGIHPEWEVESRQTANPLPGNFTDTFRELLP